MAKTFFSTKFPLISLTFSRWNFQFTIVIEIRFSRRLKKPFRPFLKRFKSRHPLTRISEFWNSYGERTPSHPHDRHSGQPSPLHYGKNSGHTKNLLRQKSDENVATFKTHAVGSGGSFVLSVCFCICQKTYWYNWQRRKRNGWKWSAEVEKNVCCLFLIFRVHEDFPFINRNKYR